jgi:hypothetical protein
MRVTIHVSDNVVAVDGRPLPIDCSAIDSNIRILHWWDTHGEVEFHTEPGEMFRRNGKLDSLTDFRNVIEAWQTMAQQLDSAVQLKAMPGRDAGFMLAQINAEPVLKALPIDEAVRLVKKIDQDPDLITEPISEAVRILETIEQSPELAERYPGPALKDLKKIEDDQELSGLTIKEAMKKLKDADERGPLPRLPPFDPNEPRPTPPLIFTPNVPPKKRP